MKPSSITALFLVNLALFILAGCATHDPSESSYNDLLSFCSLPKGNEVKDECTCLNEAIIALDSFAEKMNNSRYAVHYQAMSQQKISILRDRADSIGCKYPAPQH